jgi:hypothetical protein
MFSDAIQKQGGFHGLGVAVWRQTARGTAVLLAVLTLASCAVSPIGDGSGPAVGSKAREEAVASRVRERWDAVIKGDWTRAYGYLSPASRASLTVEQYQKLARSVAYRAAEIKGIECDAERCRVQLSVTYDHRLMKGVTTPLEETWVFDQGKPWYVYRG